MKELMLIALMWIHMTATVLWLGGITFILLVAIPSTKQVLQGEAGKVMGEVTRRFTPLEAAETISKSGLDKFRGCSASRRRPLATFSLREKGLVEA